MISGKNNNHEVQPCKPPNKNELLSFCCQSGISTECLSRSLNLTTNLIFQQKATTTASTPFLQAMAREKNMEENGRGALIADTVLETSKLYMVLPSDAEPQKKAIKHKIAAEKAKLCSNSLFKNIFANIDFEIAFANSKNIKQMIVRTKI